VIIPWHVDVPEDRWPFFNWLIIAAIIVVFVFQSISINEREEMLADKIREYENHSVEETAKELGADEQRLKEVERSVDKFYEEFKKALPPRKGSKDASVNFKENLIKRTLLEEYFVWGQIRPYILRGWTIKGLLGNIWLHGGILHLVGNLLFLWIFGNAVCAKIGNVLYAPFYILAGVLAGMAHLIFQGGGALGASGAINGVVGMFLVFFPTNDITCYYSFWFVLRPQFVQFTLSSFWMVLFWLAFDIYGAIVGGGGIGYFAHLGGFAAGVGVGIILLKCKIVKMEKWEKSILAVLADPFNKEEQESPPKYNRDLRALEQIENNEPPEAVEQKPKATPELEQRLSNSDFLKPLPPQQEFIHFVCECGKKVKIASKHAGRMGKCPQCHMRIKVPDE